MVSLFFALQFLFKRIAGAFVDTIWAYHLLAKPAHAAKLIRIAFRLDDYDLAAMKAGKGIALLTSTSGVKTEEITPGIAHYCS